MDDRPLKDDYPRLYSLCFDHNITVAEALQKDGGVLNLEELCMGKVWSYGEI